MLAEVSIFDYYRDRRIKYMQFFDYPIGPFNDSYYTRRTQPFVYGGHSIFTAEVASTVNETLLIHYLLSNAESVDMKKYLINFYIDEFKSTLFRQTMFAEFEKIAHETVENGGSLTAQYLTRSTIN